MHAPSSADSSNSFTAGEVGLLHACWQLCCWYTASGTHPVVWTVLRDFAMWGREAEGGAGAQNKCSQAVGSCLHGQLADLYQADKARAAAGTTPLYFVSAWGGGQPGARQVLSPSSGPSRALPLVSPFLCSRLLHESLPPLDRAPRTPSSWRALLISVHSSVQEEGHSLPLPGFEEEHSNEQRGHVNRYVTLRRSPVRPAETCRQGPRVTSPLPCGGGNESGCSEERQVVGATCCAALSFWSDTIAGCEFEPSTSKAGHPRRDTACSDRGMAAFPFRGICNAKVRSSINPIFLKKERTQVRKGVCPQTYAPSGGPNEGGGEGHGKSKRRRWGVWLWLALVDHKANANS